MNDDAELLERIRKGATDEFAELVSRHKQQVATILHRYERDAQRLEDLLQETYVKAWRALASFDGRAPFQHWISKIAVRTAIDHLRKRRRSANEIGFDELGEGAADWLRSDGAGDLEVHQARELLDAAMAKLSPEERVVITLLEIEERSVKEIAALTGSSAVAVKVRAHRARKKLRTAIEELEGHKT